LNNDKTWQTRFGSVRRWWPWWVLVIATLAVHGELLLGRVLFHGDALVYQWPEKLMIREALLAGRLPWLNPYILCGAPVVGNPDAGSLYPLNLLLVLGPPWLGLNLFLWSHCLLAAFSMYIFLRKGVKIIAPLAVTGGAAYALSGYVWSVMDRGGYRCAWLIPLWLLFVFRGSQARSWQESLRGWLAGAVVLSLLLVCGNAQEAAVAVVAGLGATVLAGLEGNPQGSRPSPAIRYAMPLGAILVATLLAAPQLLPATAVAERSYRAGGIPLVEAQFWSFPPVRWLELAIPFPLGTRWHQGLAYAGIYPESSPFRGGAGCAPWADSLFVGIPLLLGVGVFLATKKDWRGRFLLLLLVASALLAMGRFLPAYALLYWLLPAFRVFRHPEKFLFWTHFSLICAGCLGLQATWRGRPRALSCFSAATLGMAGILLTGMAILAGMILVAPARYAAGMIHRGSSWPPGGMLSWQAMVIFLSLTATASCFVMGRRWHSRFALGMMLITVSHLVILAWLPPLNRTVSKETALSVPTWTRHLPAFDPSQWRIFIDDQFRAPPGNIPASGGDYRGALCDYASLRHNVPGIMHLRSPQGFSPVMDASYLDFFDFTQRNPDELFDLLGVRHLAVHPIPDTAIPRGSRITYRSPENDFVLLENTDALPRISFCPDDAAHGHVDALKILVDEPGKIYVQTAGPGLLRIADWHLPGWRCRDGTGRILPIVDIDGGLMSVRIPPNSGGKIRLDYRPPGWMTGVGGLVIGTALLGMGFAFSRTVRQRDPAGSWWRRGLPGRSGPDEDGRGCR
jgi:hypothetical protein